jgi:hypothetical protein
VLILRQHRFPGGMRTTGQRLMQSNLEVLDMLMAAS